MVFIRVEGVTVFVEPGLCSEIGSSMQYSRRKGIVLTKLYEV